MDSFSRIVSTKTSCLGTQRAVCKFKIINYRYPIMAPPKLWHPSLFKLKGWWTWKASTPTLPQPFLRSNTSQKGLGLFIKWLANKGPINWQAIAFTASYHNLWESFRPKSILHTSVPTRCHTHSHLKPLTRSATAVSYKTFVFARHFWNHAQPFHPLLARRTFFGWFVCLL